MNIPKVCYVMSKPTSSVCNLNCTYCYYLEKEKIYPEQKNYLMDDDTLERYIEQYINAQDVGEVHFVWQGGEPTLAGIEFYVKALKLQKKYARGKKIFNSLQTNGILLNESWCNFFYENQFLIGVSIDGPEDLHDTYRVTRQGKTTFNKVMDAIQLLKKYQVEFNTLTVVSDVNVKYPERVYEFLKATGSSYIQFIPLLEREAQQGSYGDLYYIDPSYTKKSQVTSWSVNSLEYGEFLSRIFDIWVRKDIDKVYVQMFDTTLGAWCDQPAQLCIFSETCGHAFALESNGDIYQCDHYVYPEYKLGSLHNDELKNINQSEIAIQFGQDKKSTLSNACIKCDYRFACHGGCPKHRFISISNSPYLHNYFCEGYKYFFRHSETAMNKMKKLIMSGRSPSELMNDYNHSLIINKNIRRNDPCFCNSGKKYKKCCG
ncbi:anaerobic sulfatase maturase [Aliivibrio fischeri]|uniref:Arylsulfatase-activating protein aslB n=1 Tax=Aliivibrio fischeri SR5 TaxID=1088719 RepID=A0AAV3EQ27_ALIFS|nr:anaerobic sulfatase maturase [Aliivibrio fischeri]EHN68754.1 arylsulfatase-activating protein aslB [Aliivibrio fischeri SR5]